MLKNEKHFKKRTKSRDAAIKKNRYKRSRDRKSIYCIYLLTTTPRSHTHRFHPLPLATPIHSTHSPQLSSILLTCAKFKVWMTIVESGWNIWVWLVGVVVRRYIDFLILLIPTPLVSVLFYSSIPTFCSFLTLGAHARGLQYLLTLGAHARSEGYCSCPVCLCVCLFVVFCHHAHLDPEI